jgi:hypothetical protein
MLNFIEWLEARQAPTINPDVKKWIDSAEKLKVTIEKLKAALKKKEEEKAKKKPEKKKPEEEKKPEKPEKEEKPEEKEPEEEKLKRPEKPKQPEPRPKEKEKPIPTNDKRRPDLSRRNARDRQTDQIRDKEVDNRQD